MKYFETHERIPTQVLSTPVFLKKAFAVLLALAVLTALALAAGAGDLKTGFLCSYGLWMLGKEIIAIIIKYGSMLAVLSAALYGVIKKAVKDALDEHEESRKWDGRE